MRRLITIMALAVSLPLAAQEAQAPRIVFFNLSQLVESSVKAKKIFTELEVTGKNLQGALDQKAADAQKIQQQIQSGAVSDQGKEQLQKQLRDMDYEFKKLQADSQEDLKKVQQKVMGELNRVVIPIVNDLAKERKIQVVLNGDQAAQLVVWADTEWTKSFTAEIAKRLDAAPEGGSAPAAKPAAKPAGAAKPAAKPAK
jgi:Skp family chaperone for outer membrane proteins